MCRRKGIRALATLSSLEALLDCFCLPNSCSYGQCNGAENVNECLQGKKKNHIDNEYLCPHCFFSFALLCKMLY